MVERFRREAEALKQLRHPGVVSLHEAGESGDHLYLAMELIEGLDLAQIIQIHKTVPLCAALAIARDVSDASSSSTHMGSYAWT
jgi:serine/threonine-protein kinase